MERRFSAPVVVLFWAAVNAGLIAILAGFWASGSYEAVVLLLGVVFTALVFVLAGLVWLVRRRRRPPLSRGLRVAPRPAAAVLLAVGIAMIWLGLPFGEWLPIMAAFPLAAAVVAEVYARWG